MYLRLVLNFQPSCLHFPSAGIIAHNRFYLKCFELWITRDHKIGSQAHLWVKPWKIKATVSNKAIAGQDWKGGCSSTEHGTHGPCVEEASCNLESRQKVMLLGDEGAGYEEQAGSYERGSMFDEIGEFFSALSLHSCFPPAGAKVC